jgi:pantoate--beta-alanine ligase
MAFQKGVSDAQRLRELVIGTIEGEPLAELQYVSCAAPDSLEEIEGEVHQALISLAVKIGNTRLIDNIIIGN